MSKYSTSVVLIAKSKEQITKYLTALKLNISDLFGDNERTQTNKKRLTIKGKNPRDEPCREKLQETFAFSAMYLYLFQIYLTYFSSKIDFPNITHTFEDF